MLRSENLIPLNSGAYQARSLIADAQVAENVFPEINPDETTPDVAVTHYPREGKRPLTAAPAPGLGRGVFTMSNGALYAVVGGNVYSISPGAFAWSQIGQIQPLTTPVSMKDNGATAVLVDGTPQGYTITLQGNIFSPLYDDTGSFNGSRRVDFADTYLAFSPPDTNEWIVSLSDQVAFNALVEANKDTRPDKIQTLAFNIRQAWLIGTQSSEVWYLAGGTPFPYAEWPNVYIPFGTIAPYSLAQADVDLFWLSRNPEGSIIAVKTDGYGVVAISTRALEYEWSKYATVSDCIGSCFQQAGHTFVIFNFPGADITWSYDLATKQWHRRTFMGPDGIKHRESTTFYTSVGPEGGFPTTIIGQDWQTGAIYALDPTFYKDHGQPIICKRSFPHVLKDMHMLTSTALIADFETGGIVGVGEDATAKGAPPVLQMRYSKNGGASFSNYRQKGLVSSGHYRSMMRFRNLGQARDWIFEFQWSFNGPSALQGAYIEQIEHLA